MKSICQPTSYFCRAQTSQEALNFLVRSLFLEKGGLRPVCILGPFLDTSCEGLY